ncbi:hypothetical protein BC936DRAFT_140711 [Jimgerdemannia flammicorona]|uniref:Uncharacterized protein n=1 Tax=Jimgerdemannia flammicorona TaxID=994334 RepID=A0A433DGM9_9FUNG|nr:hypothetical protein BC936DRAFT_140711 [Jimgerdemannia flammicorona]
MFKYTRDMSSGSRCLSCGIAERSVFIAGDIEGVTYKDLDEWLRNICTFEFIHILKNQSDGYGHVHFKSEELASQFYYAMSGRSFFTPYSLGKVRFSEATHYRSKKKSGVYKACRQHQGSHYKRGCRQHQGSHCEHGCRQHQGMAVGNTKGPAAGHPGHVGEEGHSIEEDHFAAGSTTTNRPTHAERESHSIEKVVAAAGCLFHGEGRGHSTQKLTEDIDWSALKERTELNLMTSISHAAGSPPTDRPAHAERESHSIEKVIAAADCSVHAEGRVRSTQKLTKGVEWNALKEHTGLNVTSTSQRLHQNDNIPNTDIVPQTLIPSNGNFDKSSSNEPEPQPSPRKKRRIEDEDEDDDEPEPLTNIHPSKGSLEVAIVDDDDRVLLISGGFSKPTVSSKCIISKRIIGQLPRQFIVNIQLPDRVDTHSDIVMEIEHGVTTLVLKKAAIEPIKKILRVA